ncbi:MAG: hypothetical protein IPJ19_00465 [Planctomycetes bacterium]|nr:hypothetical protein [Planctomycetota bacterium]
MQHAGVHGDSFMEKLNSTWHEKANWFFAAIVIGHWGEHLLQAYQIYVMGMPRPQALGMLGMVWPWLVKSESLHYGYALVMLIGLWLLRKGFVGRSHTWWMISFWIQFWHHIEHALLQGQVLFQHNLFGKPVPTSIVQLIIPRVELHLFYNSVVFVPMVIAMYYHLLPNKEERSQMKCACALKPHKSNSAHASA